MPEMRFEIEWPDGTRATCYSPSLVIKDYLEPGQHYKLDDFIERSRTALRIASDRVEQKYGVPCGRALGQLSEIERVGAQFAGRPDANVAVLSFHE
jgi:uncharacterized repeat protein (TIGR04042 family)